MKANEAYMYEVADQIIDEFIDKGRFNVITDFGQPFAQLVIAELIGTVRPHPGDVGAEDYAAAFKDATGRQLVEPFDWTQEEKCPT